MRSNVFAAIEPLEGRRLLSAGVYAPHSIVRGETMGQYAADWWTQVLQTPVVDAKGNIINPNFDPTGALAAQGDVDKAFFLFGSITGGTINRSADVPSGTPLFVPVLPEEWSNADTPTLQGTLPGNYTAAQLSGLANESVQSVLSAGEVHASIDGQSVPNVAAHREIAPTFSYALPPANNVDQFFGNNVSGPVSPAEADGFYLMLRPLAPGQHVIEFGGTIPNEPQLGPANLGPLTTDVTYTLNVVPKGQYDKTELAAVNAAASSPGSDPGNSSGSDADHKLFNNLT